MSLPKIDFTTICDNAFISEGNKKLNIIGIFERIFANKLPAVHPNLAAVVRFDSEGKDYRHKFKAEIVKHGEESNPLSEITGEMHIEGSKQKFQMILNFQLLQFSSHGEYYCKVSLDNLVIAKIPFQVIPSEK